jgi:hypothetical protein
MSFDLEVRFTGICAFVPESDFNGTSQPQRVLAVLPYGFFEDVSRPRDAADATALRRHRAMVQIKAENLSGLTNSKLDATLTWYFENQRLTFRPTDGPTSLKTHDLSNIINMEVVAPNFAKVDPAKLDPTLGGQEVTQVLIDRGELTQEAPANEFWTFAPNPLSMDTSVTQISSAIILTIPGLSKIELVAQPLGGGTSLVQELIPTGPKISITIANLCESNPILWPTKNFKALPDQDFKWYFQLLSATDRIDLIRTLRGFSLPIPRPLGIPNGQGADCSPAKMAPTPIP